MTWRTRLASSLNWKAGTFWGMAAICYAARVPAHKRYGTTPNSRAKLSSARATTSAGATPHSSAA